MRWRYRAGLFLTSAASAEVIQGVDWQLHLLLLLKNCKALSCWRSFGALFSYDIWSIGQALLLNKAGLCSTRTFSDLTKNFSNLAAVLLEEKHHGALITGLQLCTDLCKVSSDSLASFRKTIVHVLQLQSGAANKPNERTTALFVLVRLLKLRVHVWFMCVQKRTNTKPTLGELNTSLFTKGCNKNRV